MALSSELISRVYTARDVGLLNLSSRKLTVVTSMSVMVTVRVMFMVMVMVTVRIRVRIRDACD